MTTTDKLVDAIARQCFGGVLPPFPEVVCENMVKVFCVDADQPTTQRFANELYAALRERLQAQAVAEEMRFPS